jgi:hypothetical protein
MRVLILSALLGCGNDIGVTKQAQCDGLVQQQEATVDAPFDVDGDGAFDGTNPDCQATYAAADLDCDDADAAIHPGAAELACSGVDEDCDASTPDGADVDADGYTACEDCADSVATVNPGALEIACNDTDDDCDAATSDGADVDGDGYTACDDCADALFDINPGIVEVACNGTDDDCDPATRDGADIDIDGDGNSACTDCDDSDASVVGDSTVDRDADGWNECDDCDDTQSAAFPGGTEVCDTPLDEDCDGEVDDGCVSDYTGTWELDDTIAYSCTFGVVTIDFDRVLIEDSAPDVSVDALGSGAQPGTMDGTFSTATTFSTEQIVRGSCTEVYAFSATFTSANTFDGTFTADFVGSGCFDCTDQTWTFTGSR